MLKSNLRNNQTVIRIVRFLKLLKIDSYLRIRSLQGSPKYCPSLRVALPDDTARRHRAAFPPDCKESLESLHPPAYQSVRRCKGETGHQTSQIDTPYAAVSQARPEKSRDAASVGAAQDVFLPVQDQSRQA